MNGGSKIVRSIEHARMGEPRDEVILSCSMSVYLQKTKHTGQTNACACMYICHTYVWWSLRTEGVMAGNLSRY